MVHKKELRKTLSSYLKASIRIKEKDMAREVIEKKLFIESIVLLREIEDRRDFLEDEIGMDMSIYEEKFLQIIENFIYGVMSLKGIELMEKYKLQEATIANAFVDDKEINTK